VIILSLFWKAYTEKGAIASMIVGFLSVPLFKFVVPSHPDAGIYFDKLDVKFPSILLAITAGIVVSKWSGGRAAPMNL